MIYKQAPMGRCDSKVEGKGSGLHLKSGGLCQNSKALGHYFPRGRGILPLF